MRCSAYTPGGFTRGRWVAYMWVHRAGWRRTLRGNGSLLTAVRWLVLLGPVASAQTLEAVQHPRSESICGDSAAASTACRTPTPEVAFTIPIPDVIPEGLAYDPADRAFYVGSTYRRGVWRVTPHDPASAPRQFIEGESHGLWGVVGMRVDPTRRLLWLASSHAGDGMPMVDMNSSLEGRTGLFAFDLESGELRHRAELDGPGFLNDVAVAAGGTVYVTDSGGRHVYVLEDGSELEPLVDLAEYGSPNGLDLTADGTFLFVAVGPRIVRVDVESRDVVSIARESATAGTIDGLYVTGRSLVVVQPWQEGRYVTRLDLDDSMSTILGEKPLLVAHPVLDQPTTGAIVGRNVYVIGNSHLQTFRRMWDAGVASNAASLSVPTVLRTSLHRR